MYECMYVRYERVCHTISGLKMLHPEDPPPHLLEAQKTCGGGYISCGQVKYFSEISCLTPPKYSRVKGGGCLRIGRRQHAPDSSNHSLYLIKLFNSSYPEGNFGRNQLLDGSISLSPLYPRMTNDLHVSTATSLHQSFP